MTMMNLHILSLLIITVEGLGILAALHALHTGRTAQGTIAWVMALILFPYVSLPIYFVFGIRRLRGYAKLKRRNRKQADERTKEILHEFSTSLPLEYVAEQKTLERISTFRFLNGNSIDLLIDGKEFYQSLFEEIDNAKTYILLQYYIIRSDELGNELKERLIRKSREGVKIYLIYDVIGSFALSGNFIRELSDAGVHFADFSSKLAIFTKLALNFRNHRKITLVDGEVALIGGFNIGNEYLGGNTPATHWRDTAIKIHGPAVLQIQLSFLRDWQNISEKIIDLNWEITRTNRNSSALVTATGPATELEEGSLYLVEKINIAKKRIWLSTAYFVPDSSMLNALHLAALGGVDVRIIIPKRADILSVHLASYFYANEALPSKIRMFRYGFGMLHQKVMLIDDDLASVGSGNLDNRSFRLNFEIDVLINDPEFAKKLENAFEFDFEKCKEVTTSEYTSCSFLFKTCVQIARLMSPIL